MHNVARWDKEGGPGGVGKVNDKIDFGFHRGKTPQQMAETPSGIKYLQWILTQPEVEFQWGVAARAVLKECGEFSGFKADATAPVYVEPVLVDSVSKLFLDIWFAEREALLIKGDLSEGGMGLHSWIVNTLLAVGKVEAGDSAFGIFDVDYKGIVWCYRSSGAFLHGLNVFDLEDVPSDYTVDSYLFKGVKWAVKLGRGM